MTRRPLASVRSSKAGGRKLRPASKRGGTERSGADDPAGGGPPVSYDGVVVGERSIIGAGALVTGGTEIPSGSLVLGSPAKVVRTLTADEQAEVKGWAEKYVENRRKFLARTWNQG